MSKCKYSHCYRGMAGCTHMFKQATRQSIRIEVVESASKGRVKTVS